MGTDVVRYDKAWADEARKTAEAEQLASGSFLSTAGGILSYDGEKMPGNQICVVILDAVRENTYYPHKWEKGSDPVPPTCFAFGRSDEEMEPHEAMVASEEAEDYFEPQNDTCDGCPMNEWGSGQGRGKACQNRRRLALIPAGFYEKAKRGQFDLDVFEDERDFAEAELVFLKLPVTSVRNWSKYVNYLNDNLQRPPRGVMTRIYIENDTDNSFEIHFELIEPLDGELYETIEARHREAAKSITQPYQPPNEEDGGSKRRGIKDLRKKRRRD